jgi:hypothetical protein
MVPYGFEPRLGLPTVIRVRRLLIPAALVWVVAGAAVALGAAPEQRLSTLGRLLPAPPAGTPGPELVPIPHAPALAPSASVPRLTRTVDGIRCQKNERLRMHVHTHLTLVVNGKARLVPAGIGIWPPLGPQSPKTGLFVVSQKYCFSWLSTHFADGIIHTESPVPRTFRLGQFFDVWGQPLSRTRLGPVRGPVTAIVDGKVWTGDPRRIPLVSHTQVQLEVGTPLVAPEHIRFPGSF